MESEGRKHEDKKHYVWFDWAVKHMLRDKANFDAPGLAKARETLMYDKMSPGEQKQYRDHLDEVRPILRSTM